jgi:hypothetical protein
MVVQMLPVQSGLGAGRYAALWARTNSSIFAIALWVLVALLTTR